jgi:cytidyltransferase-like protein
LSELLGVAEGFVEDTQIRKRAVHPTIKGTCKRNHQDCWLCQDMDLEDGSNRTLSDTNSIKKGNCFHEKDAARTSLPVLEEDSKPKGTTTTSKTTTTTLSPNTTRVYVDMVGDLFHYGHMRFIKQVRQSAETIFPSSRIEIVVGITADKYLADYKRKPCTSNHERAETVEGCKYVDEVIPNVPLTTTDAFMTLHHLDCIFHGDDYTTEQIAKYYGEIDARNAYYSVPYSSNAVSTTMLLRTAANRQAAFLSKLVSGAAAAATTAATTAVPTDTVSGFTFRSYVGPIADESESERLLDLLNLYGPFYKDVFGPDMAWRLLDAGEGQSGLEGRSAWCVAPVDTWGTHNKESTTKNNDNLMMRIVCVSHCCCIFNPVQKKEHCNIGLFGQVITDPRYRRRGLSTTLVGKVLQDWDTNHSDGWLILGTVRHFFFVCGCVH